MRARGLRSGRAKTARIRAPSGGPSHEVHGKDRERGAHGREVTVARPRWLALLAAVALAGCARREPAPGPGLTRRWPEHLAFSVAAIGHPGAKRAFQVGPGASVWTGETSFRWRLEGDTAARVTPIAFDADGVPVARVDILGARESVAVEAAAVPDRALGDSSLLLSVRVRVTRQAADPGECALALEIGDAPPGAGVRAWDTRAVSSSPHWDGTRPVRGGREVARLPEGFHVTETAGTSRASWRRRLSPGETAEWEFLVPLYPVPAGTRVAERAHADVTVESRRWWREQLARSTQLRTGRAEYDALERASLVTLLACEERSGSRLVPIGSPFQYRDVWLRDGARSVRALALAGQRELAADAARAFVDFQRPSGVLVSQRGQLDGTGQALWAFEQAASHPRDAKLARELLPTALGGVRWLRAQSESTLAMRLPWPGLLPYGDPHDNELVRAPLVGNDAWAIAGASAAARLARLAGDEPAVRECSACADSLRARFARALDRVPGEDVPPSWPGPGRDWGNFTVAYPTGALPPGHPRVRALVARGLARGIAGYGPADTLHAYLGADLAMSALLDGRGGLARAYLDSLLAHSSSTLGQAELFSRLDGGFGTNLPPHATAAATALDLVHALVAVEDGDTLVLGAGLTADMWPAARVAHAPTRFGALEVRFTRRPRSKIRNEWTASWQGIRAAWVRVRVPEGEGLRDVGGRTIPSDGGRWIVARPGVTSVRFETQSDSTAGDSL